MPRPPLLCQRAVDYLSQERRWITLQQLAIAIDSKPKAVRVAIKPAVKQHTVYHAIADGRACFCIGIIPRPRLKVADLPAKGKVPPPRNWTLDIVRDRCDEVGNCWLWKQGVQSKGYPQASINGKQGQSVRTYVYTVLMGKKAPASRKTCITSRCGNALCVSPHCLIARRRSDMLREQWGEGTRKQTHDKGFVNRKLTAPQVAEIRALPPGFNQSEVARRLGVHSRTVCKVASGQSWKPAPAASVFDWRP